MASLHAGLSLVCRVKARFCAVPLANVIEIMRPLPIARVAGAPDFVSGLSVIRGEPTPVVDARRLFGDEPAQPGRFVSLRTGVRRIALAVDEVLEVRELPAASLRELPPLISEAQSDAAATIGALDRDLLIVLSDARALSDPAAFLPESEVPR